MDNEKIIQYLAVNAIHLSIRQLIIDVKASADLPPRAAMLFADKVRPLLDAMIAEKAVIINDPKINGDMAYEMIHKVRPLAKKRDSPTLLLYDAINEASSLIEVFMEMTDLLKLPYAESANTLQNLDAYRQYLIYLRQINGLNHRHSLIIHKEALAKALKELAMAGIG